MPSRRFQKVRKGELPATKPFIIGVFRPLEAFGQTTVGDAGVWVTRQKSFSSAHQREKAGKKVGNQSFRNASVPPQMRPLRNERLKLQKWFLPKSRMRTQKVTTAEITCGTGSANSKRLHLAKRFFFTKKKCLHPVENRFYAKKRSHFVKGSYQKRGEP